MRKPETVLRFAAAFAGLAVLWIGCDLTSQPLSMGGPMNVAFNPLGVPLVALGAAGVALAPSRGWVLVWTLAALVAIATAGANFWHHPPVEDGAFQSIRAGVPDPGTWPAPAFLCALALAPAGIALAASVPKARRVVPLLSVSAVAAVGAAFAFEAFASALPRSATGLLASILATSLAVALVAAWVGRPSGYAIAGQAVLLAALCGILWFAYAGPM